MAMVKDEAHSVGIASACAALGVPRSSFYRTQRPPAPKPATVPAHPTPPRALSAPEKDQERAVLNSERFQDQSPREVYATLLDESVYLCSWRTMYHILDKYQEV